MSELNSKPEITVYATNEHFPHLRCSVKHLTETGFHVVIYPVEGQLDTENEEEITSLQREFGVEVGDPVIW